MLGSAPVAEIDASGNWSRGYVYAGGDLLAVQQGGVYWSHEDDVTKSKRITDIYGNVVSTIELDPWGADTNRSTNSAFLPQNFTSYIRDANGGQDAMARRYSVGGRFSQPDPYGGSYDFTDPQSLNRYAYTKNDPVNFRDPSGLMQAQCYDSYGDPIKCTLDLHDYLFSLNSRFDGLTGGKGGGGTDQPQNPKNPANNSKKSYGARVAACCARCVNTTRLDNVIRDAGDSVGHPKVGEFVAGLTIIGSLAALGNTTLNLTSLGRYPRGGLGGASAAGSRTTWQHTVGGAAGRALEEPMIGRVGRLAGRASETVSLSLLTLEATYTQTVGALCAAGCTANPDKF
jgi:RHS repeat-associated protein